MDGRERLVCSTGPGAVGEDGDACFAACARQRLLQSTTEKIPRMSTVTAAMREMPMTRPVCDGGEPSPGCRAVAGEPAAFVVPDSDVELSGHREKVLMFAA